MSSNNKKFIISAFTEAKNAIENLINSDKKIEEIINAADLIIKCLENNSTVFWVATAVQCLILCIFLLNYQVDIEK